MADCIKQHAECILIRARGEVIAGWSVLGGGLAWAAAAYITLEIIAHVQPGRDLGLVACTGHRVRSVWSLGSERAADGLPSAVSAKIREPSFLLLRFQLLRLKT